MAEDFTNAISAFLQQRIEVEKRNVGIVVGLVDEHGTRIVCWGKSDTSTGQEVNGDTVFGICSVTKTFTALLLQDMVERGEMDLDDPVAKYLPASVVMPIREGKQITLRQLATHSSGLPPWPEEMNPGRMDKVFERYTAEMFYADLSGYTLTRDPGTEFEYSSAGLGLLGHVITHKAGTNYEALVVERICRPLKMDSTGMTQTPERKARTTQRYNELGYMVSSTTPGVWTNGPQNDVPDTPAYTHWREEGLVGFGELSSTANDLLKYVSANLGLTASSLTPLMQKTHAVHFHQARNGQSGGIDMGLGWFVRPGPRGTRLILHDGCMPGLASFAGFDKTRKRGVVVLINSDNVPGAHTIGAALLESEWQSDRRPKETTVGAGIYDSCVGQYELSPNLALGIVLFRQFLLNGPQAVILISAGVCVAIVLFLPWRATGFRRRCAAISGAILTAIALAAIGALLLSHMVCANLHPGIGVRREGDRLFAQYTLNKRKPSSVASKVLPALGFPALLWPSVPTAFWPNLPGELLPESESRFFNRLTGAPLLFSADKRGGVTGLTAHFPDSEFLFARVSDQPPKAPELPRRPVGVTLDPARLDARVGQYEFPQTAAYPTGVKMTIRRFGDHLAADIRGQNIFGGTLELFPETETNFFDRIFCARYDFFTNDTGELTILVHHQGPDLEGKKRKSE